MRGGQPSTTQPIAAPWLSPNVVTRKRWPNVLNDMGFPPGPHRCGTPAGHAGSNRPSGVSRHGAVGEAIDDALVDIDLRRLVRRLDSENRDERARRAAVRHDDRVPR